MSVARSQQLAPYPERFPTMPLQEFDLYVAWMYALFASGVCVSLVGLLVICTASLSSTVTPDSLRNSLRGDAAAPATRPGRASSTYGRSGAAAGGGDGRGTPQSLPRSPELPSLECVVGPTRSKVAHCEMDDVDDPDLQS